MNKVADKMAAERDVLSDDGGRHNGGEDTCRLASPTGRICQEESKASTEPSVSSSVDLSEISSCAITDDPAHALHATRQ